ncbi:hypothetical protein Ndes2526B_g08357 [Nannochloris sp. 'desiccata']|nr:hypothetical protein KSW81_001819 [Chlorella desiccata (nom. nud.)]KAH7616259.1 hypothetical protein NADE_001082 [Chlorella desiccata (nom. nud.)]
MAKKQQDCANCGATDGNLRRCSRCKEARYCSKECQIEHFPSHKGPCKAASRATAPIIYYFGTEDDDEFSLIPDCCQQLFKKLRSKFRFEHVDDVATAFNVLNDPDPSTKIVLAVTPWAATTKAKLPLKKFIERGGILFCCAQFSSHITPPEANAFFQKMGFPWKFGGYCRTDDQVTPTAAARFSNLPDSYSNKATRLANVDPADRIYAPTAESRVQSHVFAAHPVNTEEASAVLGKCGKGYLGYIGDVNDEVESAIVVASICKELISSYIK